MAVTTFFWDFRGPRAEGTARHFLHHLDEFLHCEALGGCSTGVEEMAAGVWAAWCRAPEEAAEPVARALRPRRQRREP